MLFSIYKQHERKWNELKGFNILQWSRTCIELC